MINKISDIKIGQEYVILLVREKKLARKCIVKSIINEKISFQSDQTEIYIDLFRKGKWSSSNLLYFQEIGIGETPEEALNNYGRFSYEENIEFSTSFDSVKD